MPRKPQQSRSKATVQAIIEAGFLSFEKHGIKGTTTRHVAEIAGISVGSLYEYFDSKEAIYEAMLQQVVREFIEILQPLIPELVQMDVRSAVVRLLYALKELLEKNGGLYLKAAPNVVQMNPATYLEPVEKALMELIMQYVMRNPRAARIRSIPTMSYIIVNGGVFTVVRYLVSPSAYISFDQLAEGLGDMVESYSEAEFRKHDPKG